MRRVVAREAPELGARVLCTEPLYYSDGADRTQDRPVNVRAGSALAFIDKQIAIVQDDANFVALVDPIANRITAVVLPPGEAGLRYFDDVRGNKAAKLDLEACIYDRSHLIAFGSGSTPRRERWVVAEPNAGEEKPVRIIDAHLFYEGLRQNHAFSGSELNLEGAACLPSGQVLFAQRGNGAPHPDLEPVDATCEVSLSELWAFIDREGSAPAPEIARLTQYELGNVSGVRLTFTDIAAGAGRVLYLAVAEASADSVSDGPVFGVALGLLEGTSGARWTLLRDQRGQAFTGKAEGLLLDAADPAHAFVVLDRDDPFAPAELCTLELSGF